MPQNGAVSENEYKRRKLIAALLTTRTKGKAAELAGISRTTVTRWLADPAFQDELREAGRESERRMIDENRRRLTEGTRTALDVLQDVMKHGRANERRMAAVSWLDVWQNLKELEDFEDRLTLLEKELKP